jgi:pyruvate dehydrogenase E1 component
MKEPGPNPEIILVYQGVTAHEVFEAAGFLGDELKDIGVLGITSSDCLFHEWKEKSSSLKQKNENTHIEKLLNNVPKDTKIITVIDGHPMTLAWIGSVFGHQIIPLGVDRFGQTGNLKELFSEFLIDTESICKLGFNQNLS